MGLHSHSLLNLLQEAYLNMCLVPTTLGSWWSGLAMP